MKYILLTILVFALFTSAIAGDIPKYEQKPHLEIKCPCGASFITYEWLEKPLLESAEKFVENHPCAHYHKIVSKNDNKQKRLITKEMKIILDEDEVIKMLLEWSNGTNNDIQLNSVTIAYCPNDFNLQKEKKKNE